MKLKSFLLVAVFGIIIDIANAYYYPYETGEPGPQNPQGFPQYRSWRSTDQSKASFPEDFSNHPRPLDPNGQQKFNGQPTHNPGQKFQPEFAEKSNQEGFNDSQKHPDYREIQNQEKVLIGQPIQSSQVAFRSKPSFQNQRHELGSPGQHSLPRQVKHSDNAGISPETDIAQESKPFVLNQRQNRPYSPEKQNPEQKILDQPIESSQVTFHSNRKHPSFQNQNYELGPPQQPSFHRQINNPDYYGMFPEQGTSGKSHSDSFHLNQQPSDYPEYQNQDYKRDEQNIHSSPAASRGYASQPRFPNQGYGLYPYEQPSSHQQISYPDYYRTSPEEDIAQDSETNGFNLNQQPSRHPENMPYSMNRQPSQSSQDTFPTHMNKPHSSNQGYMLDPYEQRRFHKQISYPDYYRTSPEAGIAQDSGTNAFNLNQQPPRHPENMPYSMNRQPSQSSQDTFPTHMNKPRSSNQGYKLDSYQQRRFHKQTSYPDYYRTSPEADIAQDSGTNDFNLNQQPPRHPENMPYSMNRQPSQSSQDTFPIHMNEPRFSNQGYKLDPYEQRRFRRQIKYPDYYRTSPEEVSEKDSETTGLNLNQQPHYYFENQNTEYDMAEQPMQPSPVALPSYMNQPSFTDQGYELQPREQPSFRNQIKNSYYYRTSPETDPAKDSETNGFNLNHQPPYYFENHNPEYGMTRDSIQPPTTALRDYMNQPSFPNQGYELDSYEQPRQIDYLDYYRAYPETAKDSETNDFNLNLQPPYYPENQQPPIYHGNQNPEYGMTGQPIQSTPFPYHNAMNQPDFPYQDYALNPYNPPSFSRQIKYPNYFRTDPETAKDLETTGFNLNEEPRDYLDNQISEYGMPRQPIQPSPVASRDYMNRPIFPKQGYEMDPNEQPRFRRQINYPDYYTSPETASAKDSVTPIFNLNQEPPNNPENQQPSDYSENQNLEYSMNGQPIFSSPVALRSYMGQPSLPYQGYERDTRDQLNFRRQVKNYDYYRPSPEDSETTGVNLNQQPPYYLKNQYPPNYPENQNPEYSMTDHSSPFRSDMSEPDFPYQGYGKNSYDQPSFSRQMTYPDYFRTDPGAGTAQNSEATDFNLNQQPPYYPKYQQSSYYPKYQQPPYYPKYQQPPNYPEDQNPEYGMTGQPIHQSPFRSDSENGFNLNQQPPYYSENQNPTYGMSGQPNEPSAVSSRDYMNQPSFPNQDNELYRQQHSFHARNINPNYVHANELSPETRAFAPSEEDFFSALPYRRALFTDGSVLNEPNPSPFRSQIREKGAQPVLDEGIVAPYFSSRPERRLSVRQPRNTNFSELNLIRKRNLSETYLGINRQRDSEKNPAEVNVPQKPDILDRPRDTKVLPGSKQSLQQRSGNNQQSGSEVTDMLTQLAESKDGSYHQIPNVYNDKMDYPKQHKSLDGHGQLKLAKESGPYGLVKQPPPETYRPSSFSEKLTGESRVVGPPKIGNLRYPDETGPSQRLGFQNFKYNLNEQGKQYQSTSVQKSSRSLEPSLASMSNLPRQPENTMSGQSIGSALFGQRKQFENPSSNENVSLATDIGSFKKDNPEEQFNPAEENIKNATEVTSFRKNNSQEHSNATKENASVATELRSVKNDNPEKYIDPVEENAKNATEVTSFRKNNSQEHSNATKGSSADIAHGNAAKTDLKSEIQSKPAEGNSADIAHGNAAKTDLNSEIQSNPAEVYRKSEGNLTSNVKEETFTTSGLMEENAANITDRNPIKEDNSGTKSEPAKGFDLTETAEDGRGLISTMNNESRIHPNTTGNNAEVGNDLISTMNNGSEIHSKPSTDKPAVATHGNSTKTDDDERYSKPMPEEKIKELKDYMASIARKRFALSSDEED